MPYALVEEFAVASPAARAALAALVNDLAPEVRMAACRVGRRDSGLLPEVTLSLLALATDPDPLVRLAAAEQLAISSDRSAIVADTLADLLDEEDQLTWLEAAYGLALRDDPRTAEAIDRVGELGAGFEHDHRASALGRWRWERNQPPAR